MSPPFALPTSNIFPMSPLASSEMFRVSGIAVRRERKLFDRDAALPASPVRAALRAPTRSWRDACADWRIEYEMSRDVGGSAADYLLDLRSLAIDPRDGAIIRTGGGGALAYTPHATTQLVDRLLPGRVTGTGRVMHFQCKPPSRSLLFEDVRNASTRSKPGFVRLFRDPTTGLVAVRAVLSERYPGTFFDDPALASVLNEVLAADAPCTFDRTPTETVGYARLASEDVITGARATLHWRNSETGHARLGFAAGLTITALDATVSRPIYSGIDAVGAVEEVEREVVVQTVDGRRAINHTLPWKDRTEDERRAIAAQRMRACRDAALRDVVKLMSQWKVALGDFHRGLGGMFHGDERTMAVEVLLDTLSEAGRLGKNDALRPALLEVLKTETRLEKLPFGSAAHVAAAWACIARDAKTLDEQQEAQTLGAEWVLEGWRGEGTGVAERRAAERATA